MCELGGGEAGLWGYSTVPIIGRSLVGPLNEAPDPQLLLGLSNTASSKMSVSFWTKLPAK